MAKEVLAPAAASPALPAVAAVNAAHVAYIHECVEVIKAHPIMKDVMTSGPVSGKYTCVDWSSVQSVLRSGGPETQSHASVVRGG